jgi:hypothetical protein
MELINNNDDFAEYKILCPDFNPEFKFENFGYIKINKKGKTFIHEDSYLWNKNKIYPINLFALSREERKKMIEKNYIDYGSGMWAISVFNFIKKCILENNFPEKKELIS